MTPASILCHPQDRIGKPTLDLREAAESRACQMPANL
jgi:hypothetical protein